MFRAFFIFSFILLLTACAPWQIPYIASDHEYTKSPKIAKGSIHNILSLVSLGDANLQKLKKEAGIRKVHHIDIASESFLLVYKRTTFTVYGE